MPGLIMSELAALGALAIGVVLRTLNREHRSRQDAKGAPRSLRLHSQGVVWERI